MRTVTTHLVKKLASAPAQDNTADTTSGNFTDVGCEVAPFSGKKHVAGLQSLPSSSGGSGIGF